MFEYNWLLMILCFYVCRKLNVNDTLLLWLNEIEFWWYFAFMFAENWMLMTHCFYDWMKLNFDHTFAFMFAENWMLMTHCLYDWMKLNFDESFAFMFAENWMLMTHCLYDWIKLNFNDTLSSCLKTVNITLPNVFRMTLRINMWPIAFSVQLWGIDLKLNRRLKYSTGRVDG
jgi:hypothetical protein